jgi:hypothetical protein
MDLDVNKILDEPNEETQMKTFLMMAKTLPSNIISAMSHGRASMNFDGLRPPFLLKTNGDFVRAWRPTAQHAQNLNYSENIWLFGQETPKSFNGLSQNDTPSLIIA